MTTFSDILDNTKDIIVFIPKTRGVLSVIYVTIDGETVRAGSRALLELKLECPVFVPTDIPDQKKCSKHVFATKTTKNRGYAVSAIVATIIMFIGKIQGIEDRNCTTKR